MNDAPQASAHPTSPEALPEPSAPPGGPSPEAVELANALFDMARSGDAERLAAYLDAGAPIGMRNAKGDTLLHLAAYHEQPATVRMLIARGAELEAENDRGQRPLSCAVFKQDLESTKALLEAGADPDGGTPSGRMTAQMFGGEEMRGVFGG